jgi:hypothetical protein
VRGISAGLGAAAAGADGLEELLPHLSYYHDPGVSRKPSETKTFALRGGVPNRRQWAAERVRACALGGGRVPAGGFGSSEAFEPIPGRRPIVIDMTRPSVIELDDHVRSLVTRPDMLSSLSTRDRLGEEEAVEAPRPNLHARRCPFSATRNRRVRSLRV